MANALRWDEFGEVACLTVDYVSSLFVELREESDVSQLEMDFDFSASLCNYLQRLPKCLNFSFVFDLVTHSN